MLGLGFASVPLYRIFCQVTGYNGTPRIGGPSRRSFFSSVARAAASDASQASIRARAAASVSPDSVADM